MISTTW